MRLYPNNVLLQARLALVYEVLNDTYFTKETAERALRNLSSPRTTIDYYSCGILYHNLKKYDEAIRDYSRATETNPKFATAYYGRGSIYNEL